MRRADIPFTAEGFTNLYRQLGDPAQQQRWAGYVWSDDLLVPAVTLIEPVGIETSPSVTIALFPAAKTLSPPRVPIWRTRLFLGEAVLDRLTPRIATDNELTLAYAQPFFDSIARRNLPAFRGEAPYQELAFQRLAGVAIDLYQQQV